MGARAVGAALDLGDHGRPAGDFGVGDDPGAELGVDDALVDELGAAGELAGRSSRARRAEVPLPQGERSTSPSAKTVTLRCRSGGPMSIALPEDDAVDVTQLRLERDGRTALPPRGPP